MKDASDEFADAILLGEHVIHHNLRHDWDNDGNDALLDDLTKFASSVTLTQELSTQLPEQTRIVEGAAAAELTVNIERGNITSPGATIEYKNTTTATSGSSSSSNLVSIARPTSNEGDIIVLFIATAGLFSGFKAPDTYNVDDWSAFMLRGDTDSSFLQHVEGLGLTRRVGPDEPATYTLELSQGAPWAAVCISIGNPGAAGICAYVTRGGSDDVTDATFTTLQNLSVEVPKENCIVISAFAASVTNTTSTWTPVDDVELADITTTRGASAQNVVVGAQVDSNPETISYTKSSTLSTTAIAGIAFTLVLAPFPVGNELQHAAWTFSELNPKSPYIGKIRSGRKTEWDVELLTEGGNEAVRMFTGRTIISSGYARSRKHSIIALDNRETMRSPVIALPSMLAENPFLTAGETLPLFPGLEITWIVSQFFQRAMISSPVTIPEDNGYVAGVGYFASPGFRRSNMFHINCHGSMETPYSNQVCAYAYTYTSGFRRRVYFHSGPYVASTEAAPHSGGHIKAKWTSSFLTGFGNGGSVWDVNSQTAGRFEFMARFYAPSSSGRVYMILQDPTTTTHSASVEIIQGGSFVLTLFQSGGPTTRTVTGPSILATDDDWHWYGVHWNSINGSATFHIDGTETTVTFATYGNVANVDTNVDLYLTCENGGQIAEIHVDRGMQDSAGETSSDIIELTDPWFYDSFVPNAFIDKSDTLLDAIPALDTTVDTWQYLQEMARSDFVSIFFDALGYAHWRNGRSDATDEGQTIVRDLTAQDSLLDIEYTSGASQIANSIFVGYSPLELFIDSEFFRPNGAIRVAGQSTLTFTFPSPGFLIRNAAFSGNITAVNTQADGSGTSITVSPYVLLSFTIGDTYGSVTIQNTYPAEIWIVDPSGVPSLVITASWYQFNINGADPVNVLDTSSIRKYRTQVLSISSDEWRQREDSAEAIATQLISDLANPKPTLRNVRIIGDPRLELGDLVQLTDSQGIGIDESYRLIGISSSYSPSTGFTQSITAREGPAVAIWDIDEWDGDEIWG